MSISKSQSHDEAVVRYAKVQARYWSDEAFRASMHENAQEALAEYGVGSQPDVTLQVILNDENNVHLIIPARPANLKTEDLEVISASGTFGTAGSIGTAGTGCGCVGTFGTAFTFGTSEL